MVDTLTSKSSLISEIVKISVFKSIETIVDFSHNKRAWTHLEPLFDILSNNIDKDNK